MRIALFSDIHANLPALEAFFNDVETEKIDTIYCLGDLVGYNIWPNEVVNEIRKRRIPCIAGNYDEGIGLNIPECGCAYKTDEDKAMGKISIAYTNAAIGDEERQYLRQLPRHIRVEFLMGSKKSTLMLVHGSPRKINEYLFEDREEASFTRILDEANADILCFGHTHKPYHRSFANASNGGYKHAINIGSVGKPKDGNPQGGYVILDIDITADWSNLEAVKVEFKRFEYDIEKAASAIEGSVLPNAYAQMLKEGK